MRSRILGILMVCHVLAGSAVATPLRIAVLDAWDPVRRAADTRPELTKLTDLMRAEISIDTRFVLVERDQSGEIVDEWILRSALGDPPSPSGALAGCDLYLFTSADPPSARGGWILRFRAVAYPSADIVATLIEETTSLSGRRQLEMISRSVLSLLARPIPSGEKTVAIGQFENATRYPLLDDIARQIRDRIEESYAKDPSARLLERWRTDRLLDEMRMQEVFGNGRSPGGEGSIFLVQGRLSTGSGILRSSDLTFQLDMRLTEVDRRRTWAILRRQIRADQLAQSADEIVQSIQNLIRQSAATDASTVFEAERHLQASLLYAQEAGLSLVVRDIRDRSYDYLPRASALFYRARGRKEVLMAAIAEATNAVYLNPKGAESRLLLAICLKEDLIAEFNRAHDLLTELSHRADLSPRLRRRVLAELTRVPQPYINDPRSRHVREADRAVQSLKEIETDRIKQGRAVLNSLRIAIHRLKNPSIAFERGLEALRMADQQWQADKGKNLFGYGYYFETVLDQERLPGVEIQSLLAAIRSHESDARPEQRLVIWNKIGQAHLNQRRWTDAAAAFGRSLEFFKESWPDSGVVNRQGLWVFGARSVSGWMESQVQTGKSEEALRAGEDFIRYPEDDLSMHIPVRIHTDRPAARIRYQLGKLHESRGNPVRALALYLEASRRDLSEPDLKENIRRLQKKLGSAVPANRFPFMDLEAGKLPAGPPGQPVTGVVSVPGKVWAGIFPTAPYGIPFFLNHSQEPGNRPGGGVYMEENGGPYRRIPIAGLPEDISVTALAVHRGRLWVATYGHGVAAYDLISGRWTLFREPEGMPMPHVISLYPDDDRLWLGFGDVSRGGLGWIDLRDQSVHIYSSGRRKKDPSKGPPAGPITAITRFRNRMYAAEYMVGIKSFERDSINPEFETIRHRHPDKGASRIPDLYNRISALAVWNGQLWIGCYSVGKGGSIGADHQNGGIGRMPLDPSGAGTSIGSRVYFVEDGLPSNSVTAFAVHQGNLFAATADLADEGGVTLYHSAEDKWIPSGGALTGRALALHSTGTVLYVGTSRALRVLTSK